MRHIAALALILGCSPTAPGPDSPDAGDARDAPPAADVVDVGVDAGPKRCSFGFINCDGVCTPLSDTNCGTCGRVCPSNSRCCYHANEVWCSFSLNCERR